MNRILACALALLLMAGCTQPAAGSSSQSPTPAAPPPVSSATASEASQSQSTPPVSQPVATAEELQTIAEEILTGKRDVTADPGWATTGYQQTTGNLALVDAFVDTISMEDTVQLKMYSDAPVPTVLVINWEEGSKLTLTSYTLPTDTNKLSVAVQDITVIYHADAFYQFTDGKELFFSVSRLGELPAAVPIADYKPEQDLPDADVTAQQAGDTAQQTRDWMHYYIGYLRDNKLGNPMNQLGVVVPRGIVNVEHAGAATKVEGAAKIAGKDYYQVSCYQDDTLVDQYYVDATDRDSLFLVSMVDGSLIPIICRKMQLNLFPEKKPAKTT